MARTQEGRNATHGTAQSRQSATLRSSFRDTGAVRLTLADSAKAHRAADTVREKAERHYEKNRATWVARRYAKLLLKAAPMLTLTPPGMSSDPKVALMNRARNEVQRDHAKRLQAIETARKTLLDKGRMRETRKIEWGGKIAAPDKVAERGLPERKPQRPAMEGASGTRPVTRSDKARISVAQDRARRRAEAHLTKHQEKWTGTRYTMLASKFELASRKLSEPDAQIVRDIAINAANRMVAEKHETRLQRIDAACDRMATSGNIRASRPMGRNLGLGE